MAPATKTTRSKGRSGRSADGPLPAPAAPAAVPPLFRVRIRMYRQGVGDSFLLTFTTPQGPASILIDCGVVTGTANATTWTQNIAADVLSQTSGGKTLYAIVGTHPHWDHLSGFLTANATFKPLASKEVWMAWTEDPKDPEGRNTKSQHEAQLTALQLAMTSLATAANPATRAEAACVNELFAFQGPDDALPGLGAAGKLTTSAALDALRGLGTVAYRNPGDIIERSWLPGVRVYVLGPPRDKKLLGKMLSSKPGDLYGLSRTAGFVSALNAAADPSGTSSDNANNPFEPSYLFTPAVAAVAPTVAPIQKAYANSDEGWRTIDDQWLLSAQTLALQLDNAINNLSLVLAFELEESKQVLLFAADAQFGNWSSWQSLEFKVKEDQQERTITARDLLERTVFYKVGHHASHNATLKEGGLEAMTHPDLVAAIPVDEIFANKSKHWQMPAPELYQRLLERTDGRVLRSDGVGALALGGTNSTFQPATNAAFIQRVRVDHSVPPLWLEYDIV